MCRYRQVQNTYTLCGHLVREPDVTLHCDDRWCKFSAAHPANCGPSVGRPAGNDANSQSNTHLKSSIYVRHVARPRWPPPRRRLGRRLKGEPLLV
ncbi:hypothetical protein BDZ89DRAFT_1107319 [Hymenopellis radicata]|nr:hypothetical protein BDZ89DRAFT_1107319 [Hymenopellis radicata]